jgi:hypothetical protein
MVHNAQEIEFETFQLISNDPTSKIESTMFIELGLYCSKHWLGTGNMRSNSLHGCFPISDNPLVFEIFPYPSSQPDSNPRLGQVHFCYSSHQSGPNKILQPQEPLHSGQNVGSFPSPYFQRRGGHYHNLKATFHILLQPGIHLGQNIGKP